MSFVKGSLYIMIFAALAGFYIGLLVNDPWGGAITLVLIAGFACIIHAIEKGPLHKDDR